MTTKDANCSYGNALLECLGQRSEGVVGALFSDGTGADADIVKQDLVIHPLCKKDQEAKEIKSSNIGILFIRTI